MTLCENRQFWDNTNETLLIRKMWAGFQGKNSKALLSEVKQFEREKERKNMNGQKWLCFSTQ